VEIDDFIIEMARAFQRYGMYPDGHPSRLTTAAEILELLTGLIGDRGELTIQVTGDFLQVGDQETDEKNSSAVNVARRLHQHQLHVVNFLVGVTVEELDGLLGIISVQVGKSMGEPFGASPREELEQWSHITLQRTPYDALRLSEGTDEFDDDRPDSGTGGGAGEEDRGGSGAASELRLQIAKLVENLDPAARQKLLKMFQTLLNATGVDGSHDLAVMKLVEMTRKGKSKQAATMLGILSKIGKQMGASDPDGPAIAPGPILGALIGHLSDEGPVAEEAGQAETPEWIGEIEAGRVLQMSVELREMNPSTRTRLTEIVTTGDIGTLADLLTRVPEGNPVTTEIVAWLEKPKNMQKLLSSETLDLPGLEPFLALVGTAAIGPMLDLLARSEDEGTRRELIERLTQYGDQLYPLVMERIDNPRWEVRSDLLTILGSMKLLPEGFSASTWYLDDDKGVRLQALRLGLARGEDRGKLLLTALRDPDDENAAFGLKETKKECPPETAGQIIEMALNGRETSGVRINCIRAMAGLDDPGVLGALLSLTWQSRALITHTLAPKTQEMLESLAVLASRFAGDPKAKAVLKAARASKDAQIRAVAGGKKESS